MPNSYMPHLLITDEEPAICDALAEIAATEGYTFAVARDIRLARIQLERQMIGRSPAMQQLCIHIEKVAPTQATVLLMGKSGTGKELAAQAIHLASPRHNKPFLAVNYYAISPNLIESELFGHEKGSFTGADRQHMGYFERAQGGTLFLDEITQMSIKLQVRLLRVLETGRFMRVGTFAPDAIKAIQKYSWPDNI